VKSNKDCCIFLTAENRAEMTEGRGGQKYSILGALVKPIFFTLGVSSGHFVSQEMRVLFKTVSPAMVDK